jgi:predicted lipoprotein with Yx(FWY)xxD motif
MTIQQIKSALIATGWSYILSSMSDQATNEYGLLFTKDGIKFWLNNKTIPIASEIIAG